MTVKQGKDMDNDVFWSVVSQRMGGKRGRQQCRIKWYFLRSRTLTPCTNVLQDGLPEQNFQEQRHKTTLEFTRRLHPRSQVNTADMSFLAETRLTELGRVDSLHVRDDSEVDWKTLPDPNWNLWSAHTLQRRWLTMKRGVRGYEDMTHAGCDFLAVGLLPGWSD
jgi:hypothetical protein